MRLDHIMHVDNRVNNLLALCPHSLESDSVSLKILKHHIHIASSIRIAIMPELFRIENYPGLIQKSHFILNLVSYIYLESGGDSWILYWGMLSSFGILSSFLDTILVGCLRTLFSSIRLSLFLARTSARTYTRCEGTKRIHYISARTFLTYIRAYWIFKVTGHWKLR